MRFSNACGFYELNPFPGCNQLVVSNHAFVLPQHRGTGEGQRQHQERLDKAKELGYDYIICTVKAQNSVEIHILEKNSWSLLDDFYNKETGDQILIYGRIIPR
jgi:predicted GNAT superfamily acetyltransferase